MRQQCAGHFRAPTTYRAHYIGCRGNGWLHRADVLVNAAASRVEIGPPCTPSVNALAAVLVKVDPTSSGCVWGNAKLDEMATASEPAGTEGRPAATRTQHAIRLLVLLDGCGEQTVDGDPPGTVKSVRSELRLQAMDFWLRNPDYLADELVSMVEAGTADASYLAIARSLLDDPEPDLRWYPMPRWFFGAYEQLDDAFSLLETYGLATLRRTGQPGKKSKRNRFFLTEAGAAAVVELAEDPVLGWYTHQVKLVALVAGTDGGQALKDRQYRQATYAGTELGVHIAPIAPRVRERLYALITTVPASDAGAVNQEGDQA